jgi:hypothetical protein
MRYRRTLVRLAGDGNCRRFPTEITTRHDLFHAALCAAFFLLMRASRWAALPVVFLLYLTRESTIVLATAIVVIALARH